LTSDGGSTRTNDPDVNDLGWSDGNHHRMVSGAVQHMQTVNNNYSAYPSGDSHPTQAGNLKATGEFVAWLNYYYARWVGAAPTPQPPSGTIAIGNPTFTWTKSAGATQYRLAVYTNAWAEVAATLNAGTGLLEAMKTTPGLYVMVTQ